jgi:D-alanine-D-alanine ligase
VPADGQISVAVLFGGRSGEHAVSCLSAASILAHLDRDRFTAVPVRIDRDGFWAVGVDDPDAYAAGGAATLDALERRFPPRDGSVALIGSVLAGIEVLRSCDVVFPALHGPFGEDGTLQSCLAFAGVPYVGCRVLSSALAMDKVRTKALLAEAGLTVADSVVLRGSAVDVDPEVGERLGLPVFVKPVRGGSSLGVSRVERWVDLPAAVAHARLSDPAVLVEAAVIGREIDIGVLELPDATLAVSPPLEIHVSDGGLFDFHAKYEDPATRFEVPAALGPTTLDRMRAQALTAFDALGCTGLLRVDFFLRPDGTLVLNEVNTFPGFTAASQYPRMWQAAGIDYRGLLDTLVDTALARSSRPRQLA